MCSLFRIKFSFAQNGFPSRWAKPPSSFLQLWLVAEATQK